MSSLAPASKCRRLPTRKISAVALAALACALASPLGASASPTKAHAPKAAHADGHAPRAAWTDARLKRASWSDGAKHG